jgi:hypothetical protein
VVHPAQAADHQVVKGLTRLGGHLYYVLNSLNSRDKRVLVVWSVHCCSSNCEKDLLTISSSASGALKNHLRELKVALGNNIPKVYGLVVISDDSLNVQNFELTPDGVSVLAINTNCNQWSAALDDQIVPMLEIQLEEILA